jgi:hypothetical protein
MRSWLNFTSKMFMQISDLETHASIQVQKYAENISLEARWKAY